MKAFTVTCSNLASSLFISFLLVQGTFAPQIAVAQRLPGGPARQARPLIPAEEQAPVVRTTQEPAADETPTATPGISEKVQEQKQEEPALQSAPDFSNGSSDAKRPNLRKSYIAFQDGISPEMKVAMLKKYPGIKIVDKCNRPRMICVGIAQVDSKGQIAGYGSGSDWWQDSRSNTSNNSWKSSGGSNTSVISYNDQVTKLQLVAMLYVEGYEPIFLAGLSNLAFAGTSTNGGNFSGNNSHSSSNPNGYRASSRGTWGDVYTSSTTNQNEAFITAYENSIKKLFDAKVHIVADWLNNHLDDRFGSGWAPGADRAVEWAFGKVS